MTIMAFALPLMLLLTVVGAQNSYVCNVETVPAGSAYDKAIPNMFVELQDAVPSNGDHYEMSIITDGGGPLYGHASCNPAVQTICGSCIGVISDLLQKYCPHAIGAQFTWKDFCFLRYESYKFY